MKTLVLGRSGACVTLVPYPTLDALVRSFAGQHVGLGYFKIRVGSDEVYLDREDAATAESFGPQLGQEQRRIYSVSMGADEFAGMLSAADPDLDFDVRECRGAATLASVGAVVEQLPGQAGLF